MKRKDIDKCKCSFRIRMVGDGCQYCNPDYNADLEKDAEREMIGNDADYLDDVGCK